MSDRLAGRLGIFHAQLESRLDARRKPLRALSFGSPSAWVCYDVLGITCNGWARTRHMLNGAGEGIRTLDPNLGKVVLYP
jgi:hypothetical protein